MKLSKLAENTKAIKGQRVAGYINWADDGDTAYVWTQTAWCASMTIQRGDMLRSEFEALVKKFAALAKNNAN